MGRNRRGDHHGLNGAVLEQIVEAVGRPGMRVARSELVEQVGREIAEPRQIGDVVEVARQVRAPVTQAREAELGGSDGGLDGAIGCHEGREARTQAAFISTRYGRG
jgi:hypothetical protein